MPLSDVQISVSTSSLGLQNPNEDGVAALVFSATAPAAYSGLKIKSYTDINAVVADGITQTGTYAEAYYHAFEFWRIAPGATLFMCFSLTNIAEEIYAASSGRVRLIGVFNNALTNVATLYQAQAAILNTKYTPALFVMGFEPASAPLFSAVTDLGTVTAPNVMVVAFGDNAGRGKALATTLSKPYISAVGTVLGLLAKQGVEENIGNLITGNITDGTEFSIVRYVTAETAYSDSLTDSYDTKRYIVPRVYAGYAGVYIEKDHTAVAATNDLSNARNVRVIGKAIRGTRTNILPRLKSVIKVQANGTLEPQVIEDYKSLASLTLRQMQRDNEISAFEVYINPDQNVLSTNLISIEIKIIPIGTANFINLKIGFAASLTTT